MMAAMMDEAAMGPMNARKDDLVMMTRSGCAGDEHDGLESSTATRNGPIRASCRVDVVRDDRRDSRTRAVAVPARSVGTEKRSLRVRVHDHDLQRERAHGAAP